MRNAKDSAIRDKYCSAVSLLQAISDILDVNAVPSKLPKGVEKIVRVTLEAVRVKFTDKIDEEMLSRIAEEEGYAVERGSFALRVIEKGTIVARVGSKSDIGGRFDLYVYLFPPEMGKISLYSKVVAERKAVLDTSTGKTNLENLCRFNLQVIKLVSRYIKERYG